ncbi:MAG: hypothetical protein Fur006_09890 [Coleofasciculaceae cyanobacterium]
MPTIKIDDLHPTGAELFSDSESYMNELGESELDLIVGGRTTPVCKAISRSVVEASRKSVEVSRRGIEASRRHSGAISREISKYSLIDSLINISNPFNSI